jgi:lipoprotein-anchoring transpeptidase ErfK/SrfK
MHKLLSGTLLASAFTLALASTAFAQDSSRGFMALFEPDQSATDPSLGQEMPQSTHEVVDYDGDYAPGSIVIDTENKVMYFTLGDGKAIRYLVGVGRPGFEWHGNVTVGRKAEWPGWTPPADMLERRPDLPRHMAGGIDNPLGARAMYLYKNGKDTMFRIHGTNEADTIGQAVSSGCIRMLNADVEDLYSRVKVGAHVAVL